MKKKIFCGLIAATLLLPTTVWAESPADLTGVWKSEENEGSYHEATITEDTMVINWVSPDINAVYWAGTYEAPGEESKEYSWESKNDHEKTDASLMGSSDETKEFTYKDGVISYEVTALGVTKTMELEYVGEAAEGASGGAVEKISMDNAEGTLVYTSHEIAQDYDGNPAIRIYFDYTNKKDEPSMAQMTFYPQVFQNGVECDMAFSMEQNEAQSNATKNIQTGTTLNVAFIYTLSDVENPVTLVVNDHSAENLFNNVKQEQELTLK